MRISNAVLTWKDEATGAVYAISEFNLKTGRVASGAPAKFDLGATIRANEPKVDVKLQVGGTLTADLEKQVFSVAGMTVKINGDAAGVTGLAAELQAEIEARTQSRQVDIGKLAFEASGGLGKDNFKAKVSAPKIGMKGDAVSVSELTANVGGVFAGVSLSEGKLRVPQLVLNLDEQTILVDGVAMSAKGKREADSFEAKLDAPKISITRDKAGGSDVILQIKAQGPRLDTSVSMKLSGVEGSGKAVRVGQLVVNVDARQAGQRGEGFAVDVDPGQS